MWTFERDQVGLWGLQSLRRGVDLGVCGIGRGGVGMVRGRGVGVVGWRWGEAGWGEGQRRRCGEN